MVEKKAGTGEQPVGLAIVRHFPEGGTFGHGIRTARTERCFLPGRLPMGIPKTFARSRMIDAGGMAEKADGLQQVERPHRHAVQGFHRLVKGKTHGALPRKMVDLRRLHLFQGLQDAAEIGGHHGMKMDAGQKAEALQTGEGMQGGIPRGPVNLVIFFQKKLRQISPVLSGNPGDQGNSPGHRVI